MKTASSGRAATAAAGTVEKKSDELVTVDAQAGVVMHARNRREVFRAVDERETTMLAIPWGPRVDVFFNPLEQVGMAGGTVHLYARTPGGQIEIASAAIPTPAAPVKLSGAFACDHYVVTAQLGTAAPAGPSETESYVFACSYADR